MKRKVTLLVGGMVLVLVFAGGAALAATVTCNEFKSNPCYGTNESDTISGDNTNNTIYALGGDDDVSSLEGNDIVYAGEGNDGVFGFRGNDTIYGGPGGDTNLGGLTGAQDSDKVYGQGGGDFVNIAEPDPSEGVDYASGGRGNDIIHAFDRRQDTISCGRGRADHVYYDKGLDSVSRNCEKKHPDQAPPGYFTP